MVAITNHDLGPIQFQNLIARIKSWKSMFRVWQSSFTRRDGNKVAHQMAKYAKYISDCIIWVEDTPPIIACQILNDVSVLFWALALFNESCLALFSKKKKKKSRD